MFISCFVTLLNIIVVLLHVIKCNFVFMFGKLHDKYIARLNKRSIFHIPYDAVNCSGTTARAIQKIQLGCFYVRHDVL